MPTGCINATTADAKIVPANPRRVGITFLNYTSVSPSGGTAAYIRIADEGGNVDSGDAFILPDMCAITLSKEKGDNVERAFYCRTYSGSGWLTYWEQVKTK